MNKLYYSYDDCKEDLILLTQKIDKDFDTIIAIARGGLMMGLMLGEYYDIRKVYSINTVGYNDTVKLNSVEVSNIPTLSSSQNVLIVDDIVDSGDSLLEVLEVLNSKYPNINFYTASIFYKSSAKIKPNWYIKEAKEWIEFFWSVDLKKENDEI